MATTTQVTSYRSAGQPDDAVGAVGDTCFDTTNRITWVKQSGNTWIGGGYSNIGPTGPAQLSGNGAPSSSVGQNGNGYCDLTAGTTYLKSNNAWTQVGSILGATGPAGPSVLGSAAANYGPTPAASSLSLTSTPQVMPLVNSTTPCVYQPIFGSSFLGCVVQTAATGTTTFTLYNQTTNAAVYSITCGANTYATSGSTLFSVAQYLLTTGHQYVWQISNTTSQTGGGTVYPIYATPSGGGTAVSLLPIIGFANSTTINSTVQSVPLIGATTGTSYYYPIRTAGLYAVTATLTATGSTATTATATLNSYYQTASGGSSSNAGYSPQTLTANGVPKTLYGPTTTDTNGLAAGYRFYHQITASTPITATLQIMTYGYI